MAFVLFVNYSLAARASTLTAYDGLRGAFKTVLFSLKLQKIFKLRKRTKKKIHAFFPNQLQASRVAIEFEFSLSSNLPQLDKTFQGKPVKSCFERKKSFGQIQEES